MLSTTTLFGPGLLSSANADLGTSLSTKFLDYEGGPPLRLLVGGRADPPTTTGCRSTPRGWSSLGPAAT